MSRNHVQPGVVIDYTAAANIAAGAVVLMGTKVGVALNAIANGAVGPLQISEVFLIAKNAPDVVAQGAALYWDNTNSRLTTTASGNTYAGFATKAAGNGATTVEIKLNA